MKIGRKPDLSMSLLQVFSLVSIVAALIYLSIKPAHPEPIWRRSNLVYRQPAVPPDFEAVTESPVVLDEDGNSRSFDDADQLYMVYHLDGWEQVRLQFYQAKNWEAELVHFDFFEEYDLAKIGFRSSYDHAALAQFRGKQECREQIKEMLQEQTASELRHKIAFPPIVRQVPAVGVIVFSFAVLVVSRRRSGKTG